MEGNEQLPESFIIATANLAMQMSQDIFSNVFIEIIVLF